MRPRPPPARPRCERPARRCTRSAPSVNAATVPPWWLPDVAHRVGEPPLSRALVTTSFVLIAGALLLVMWEGLLPGLLSVCIGFLGTRWLARVLHSGMRGAQRVSANDPAWAMMPSLPRVVAATVVMLAPLGLLAFAFSEAREFVLNAPEQYQELLDYIARN